MEQIEVVRGSYYQRRGIPFLALYDDTLMFNNRCIELLDCEYALLIVDRNNMSIRVRGSRSSDFNAVRWYDIKHGQKVARKIRSRMMTALLFDELGYDCGHRYKLFGVFRDEEVPELVFDTSDPQVYVMTERAGRKRFVPRYPEEWRDSFGIPLSGYEGHNIKTFEEYTVLDVTLESVDRAGSSDIDGEELKRMRELKEKYIRGVRQ